MDSRPAAGNSLYHIKRITGIILLLALSATFFYSAYTKSGVEFNTSMIADAHAATKGHSSWMLPVNMAANFWVETAATSNAFDSFQWTFLDFGINSIVAGGIIARLMIGLELLLGLFLLLHIFLRRFTYPTVIAILSVFIIYLLLVIMKQGNTGNCGCFGNKLAMTPLAAIVKNVIMIGVTILLMYIYPVKPYRNQAYVAILAGCLGLSMPFIVNPMYTGTAPVVNTTTVDLNLLYKYDPAPPVDLRTGKHIVAFMSLTCPHCRKAAYLLQIIHHQHPDIPIFIVLDGPETYKKQFFDETHAENVPYLYYRHTPEFTQMAGPGVPAIYWFNNGKAEYKSAYAYYQLDPKYMEEWMKKP